MEFNWLWGVLGILLLTINLIDVVQTTLSQGGGWLSARTTAFLWTTTLRRNPPHAVLQVIGLVLFLATIAFWLVMLWIGWSLVFSASPWAVHLKNGGPASFIERCAYVSFSLVTLTLGDYRPGDVAWEIATSTMTASGFMMITLSISFAIPVLQAVTSKRQLGVYISTLGTTPTAILRGAWNGRDFKELESHLGTVSSMMSALAQRKMTYPVISYFHTGGRSAAAAPAIAALDDALSILSTSVPESARPSKLALAASRDSILAYLTALGGTRIGPTGETDVPPVPDCRALQGEGLPIDQSSVEGSFSKLEQRRKRLNAAVRHDGWRWKHVVTEPE